MAKLTAKPNSSEAKALLEEVADAACFALFEAYGVQLHRGRSTTTDLHIHLCGVAGFTGPGIRGTCILASTEKPIMETIPVAGSLRDWIAELANQLVGRIKNKLLQQGAEVYVTTPVVLRGEHIAPISRRRLPPMSYMTDGGSVFVWIEIETTADFQLGTPTPTATEGEALLF